MPARTELNLNVDLQRGVVPISKAASSLAALIKWAHGNGQPVIVTQKGYPTGVLLPIELFTALRSLATGEGEADTPLPPEVATVIDSLAEDEAPEPAKEEAPPARPAPRRRRRSSTETAEVKA